MPPYACASCWKLIHGTEKASQLNSYVRSGIRRTARIGKKVKKNLKVGTPDGHSMDLWPEQTTIRNWMLFMTTRAKPLQWEQSREFRHNKQAINSHKIYFKLIGTTDENDPQLMNLRWWGWLEIAAEKKTGRGNQRVRNDPSLQFSSDEPGIKTMIICLRSSHRV